MQKIFEWKNLDWLKGLSAQANVALGGLFAQLNGVDPFEQGGLALPSTVPDNQTLATTAKVLTNWNSNSFPAVNHLYAHSDSKLYDVLSASPYTVVDKTSQINQGSMAGTLQGIGGAIIYQGKYVYASLDSDNNCYINANSLPVQAANDVLLNEVVNVNLDYIPFCIGPDGILYYGGDGFIGEITSVTGTSGNATTRSIDAGFRVRDISHDGTRLIIVADNNAVGLANRAVGKYKIQIYFWDLNTTESNGTTLAPTIKWEFEDSYAISVKFLENAVYVFTYNGLYVCNISTSPKLLRPWPSNLLISGRPYNGVGVTAFNGSLYWINQEDNSKHYIYAYGNPITGQQKIFYQPYQNVFGTFSNNCLTNAGKVLIMGVATNGLYFFNVGSTRGDMSVLSIDTNMEAPYTFGYVKVVLAEPLTTGQTVQCVITSAGGTNQISLETKSYNSAKPKQTFKFTRNPAETTNQSEKSEDIIVGVSTNGAALQRVAAYATPCDDSNEDL